ERAEESGLAGAGRARNQHVFAGPELNRGRRKQRLPLRQGQLQRLDADRVAARLGALAAELARLAFHALERLAEARKPIDGRLPGRELRVRIDEPHERAAYVG